MGYGVTKWPKSDDPRGAAFGSAGFATGAVPPYAWVLTAADAQEPFSELLEGVIVWPTNYDTFTLFYYQDSSVENTYRLAQLGQNVPLNSPSETSMTWSLRIQVPGYPDAIGSHEEFYPYALKQQGPILMSWDDSLLPVDEIPMGLVLTPTPWTSVQ